MKLYRQTFGQIDTIWNEVVFHINFLWEEFHVYLVQNCKIIHPLSVFYYCLKGIIFLQENIYLKLLSIVPVRLPDFLRVITLRPRLEKTACSKSLLWNESELDTSQHQLGLLILGNPIYFCVTCIKNILSLNENSI